MKRFRIARSSSLGEVGLFTHIQPIDPPSAIWQKKRTAVPTSVSKPAQKAVQNAKSSVKISGKPRGGILRLASPPRNERSEVEESYGVFHQTCFACQKKISEDVYMYGYMRAFCSHECRLEQMILEDRNVSPNSRVAEIFLKNKSEEKRSFGNPVRKYAFDMNELCLKLNVTRENA